MDSFFVLLLDIFQPYHTLKDLGTVLFQWATLVMLLVAGVVAAASPVSHEQDGPLVEAVLTSQRCVRVIQCGLILFLLLFSRYLGVSRKQKSFGIALGFGFFAGVELFLVALIATRRMDLVKCGITNMVAYNLSIMVWLGYMWVKEKAREPSANLLMSQRWDQSFMDLQHPMSEDSLIPMFENMVEEAISRVHENSTGAIQDAREPDENENDMPSEPETTLPETASASLAPSTGGGAPSERANSATASGSTSKR